MVNSVLDTTVNYIESAEIDPSDLDYDANLYETTIFDKNITFALGKPNYTYIDNNIVYYSIYLVENDKITLRIGLYEIIASEQENIIDDDGDIDLNHFDKPLLYSFTYDKLHKGANIKQKETLGKSKNTNGQSEKKKTSKKAKWIQEFMSNTNYDIIDVKYDGNCFFSVLQLALEENGQDVSIDDMRDILANNATEELFQNYKTIYDDLKRNETVLTNEIKNIAKRHTSMIDSLKKTKDRNLFMSLETQSSEIKKKHDSLKSDRKQTRETLIEFEFMNGIDNLSMLKLKMKTKEFWADTWAISTLERELNLKTIIFSELHHRENDELNVLQCGQHNDTTLEERGIFEPSFYVLAAYHGGYHYQLITHTNDKSFTFAELPDEVKVLVSEKCLEKIAGLYSLIPEFKDYALKIKTKNNASSIAEFNEKLSSDENIQASTMIVSPIDTIQEAEPLEELSSDLYNSGTVFRFYSKSTGKPLPGKGSGETIGSEGPAAYEELARIPDWRKKLSNFWAAEFKLDGHRWLSVEHYYQASKFKRNNKDFYIKFSLDSVDSSIATDASLAKAAGGKSGKFKGELIRPKNITIDPDFFQKAAGVNFSRGEIEMESAMRAKFTQNADLKELLLATKKAKLEHITRGKPAIVFNDLMRVRREITESI